MPGTSPRDILRFDAPSTEFLCPLSANRYNIEFVAFEIRDASKPPLLRDNPVLFSVSKDSAQTVPHVAHAEYDAANSGRVINYQFPTVFLRLRTVLTKLRFSVGDLEVRNFRMIERHYTPTGRTGFRLLKNYDFVFPFCIPNSTNEWEATYDLPVLSEAEVASIAQSGTISDSFYFVDDELVMHNRANYSYQ